MQLNSAIFDCIYLRDTEVLFFKTDNYGQLGGHILRKFIFNECSWPITNSQFCNKVHVDLFKHTTEKALNIVKNHNVSNHFFYVCTSKWQSKSPVCDTSQRHIKYGCVFISVSIVFMHVYMLFTSYTYEQNIRI